MVLDFIARNQYHHSGVIVARLAVVAATMIWALIVLVNSRSLEVTKYGNLLTQYVHENVIASAFLTLSLALLYRIVRQSKPHKAGVAGYGALVLAWGYVEFMLILSPGPWQPTAVSWVTPGFVLALYSFIAAPKAGNASGI